MHLRVWNAARGFRFRFTLGDWLMIVGRKPAGGREFSVLLACYHCFHAKISGVHRWRDLYSIRLGNGTGDEFARALPRNESTFYHPLLLLRCKP